MTNQNKTNTTRRGLHSVNWMLSWVLYSLVAGIVLYGGSLLWPILKLLLTSY